MATRTVYHLGGFDPVRPAQNRAEEWTTTGYTRWNTAGTMVEARALTAAESTQLAADDAALTRGQNDSTLRDKAQQALAVNDAFLALASPTNAQVVTHVQRLTRENTALIRLVIGALDSTSGT